MSDPRFQKPTPAIDHAAAALRLECLRLAGTLCAAGDVVKRAGEYYDFVSGTAAKAAGDA